MNTVCSTPVVGKAVFAKVALFNFTQLFKWLIPVKLIPVKLIPVKLAQPARVRRWVAAVVLAVAFAPALEPQQLPDTQGPALAYGKRYLRINEYLFNGTQPAKAIAWQAKRSGDFASIG